LMYLHTRLVLRASLTGVVRTRDILQHYCSFYRYYHSIVFIRCCSPFIHYVRTILRRHSHLQTILIDFIHSWNSGRSDHHIPVTPYHSLHFDAICSTLDSVICAVTTLFHYDVTITGNLTISPIFPLPRHRYHHHCYRCSLSCLFYVSDTIIPVDSPFYILHFAVRFAFPSSDYVTFYNIYHLMHSFSTTTVCISTDFISFVFCSYICSTIISFYVLYAFVF